MRRKVHSSSGSNSNGLLVPNMATAHLGGATENVIKITNNPCLVQRCRVSKTKQRGSLHLLRDLYLQSPMTMMYSCYFEYYVRTTPAYGLLEWFCIILADTNNNN